MHAYLLWTHDARMFFAHRQAGTQVAVLGCWGGAGTGALGCWRPRYYRYRATRVVSVLPQYGWYHLIVSYYKLPASYYNLRKPEIATYCKSL